MGRQDRSLNGYTLEIRFARHFSQPPQALGSDGAVEPAFKGVIEDIRSGPNVSIAWPCRRARRLPGVRRWARHLPRPQLPAHQGLLGPAGRLHAYRGAGLADTGTGSGGRRGAQRPQSVRHSSQPVRQSAQVHPAGTRCGEVHGRRATTRDHHAHPAPNGEEITSRAPSPPRLADGCAEAGSNPAPARQATRSAAPSPPVMRGRLPAICPDLAIRGSVV